MNIQKEGYYVGKLCTKPQIPNAVGHKKQTQIAPVLSFENPHFKAFTQSGRELTRLRVKNSGVLTTWPAAASPHPRRPIFERVLWKNGYKNLTKQKHT